MTEIEYRVIGSVFALCVGGLFAVAIPFFVIRYVIPNVAPPEQKGKVRTEGFGLIDFIGITVIIGYYAWNFLAAKKSGGTSLAEAENLALLLGAQLVFQSMMIGAVIAFLHWRVNVVQAFGLKWKKWWWVLLLAPCTVWLMWSFMAVLHLAGYNDWMKELVGGDPSQEAVQLLQGSSDLAVLILLSLVAVVGAPLSEEVVFRGYLYPVVKRFTNIPVAVLLTGLLFGAVHLNLAALLPLTVLGIALALLYELTGSLWAPIAVHCLFNAGTVAMQFLARVNPEIREKLQENAAIIGFG